MKKLSIIIALALAASSAHSQHSNFCAYDGNGNLRGCYSTMINCQRLASQLIGGYCTAG